MIAHFVAHITGLLVIAFFVFFAASKADGLIKLFGMLMGAWLVIIAVLMVVAGVMHAGGWHGGWMHHDWMHSDQMQTAPAQPAPAQPSPTKPPGG